MFLSFGCCHSFARTRGVLVIVLSMAYNYLANDYCSELKLVLFIFLFVHNEKTYEEEARHLLEQKLLLLLILRVQLVQPKLLSQAVQDSLLF